ncbi:M16 family metallopeptidase [Leeuwenhoekiella sp. MAR_2009_132]|uniref:M16 family metallopeptidase n=1 Tax=Leeuwenhoekiella sp. MAR_2009_132 TaxID=1392489 RepID=UPI00048ACC98|nr:insulinase family protein [Leeuwenhoekiella sp. MAR_2009_132]
MQDINLLRITHWFLTPGMVLGFMLCGLYTYGQEDAGSNRATSMRSGTLDNGMRYVILSNAAWEGQPVLMNVYVGTGHSMEAEGQRDLSHYVEHLPFSILREEAAAKSGAVQKAIRTQRLPLQAGTYLEHTVYNYEFDRVGSEVYTAGMDLFSRLIGGKLQPSAALLNSEQESFYQEYLYRKGYRTYDESRVLALLSNAYPAPVNPDAYYKHIKDFDGKQVSDFFKDWYQPQRTTLLLAGAVEDLDAVTEDIKRYFGSLKPGGADGYVSYKNDYLGRSRQFVKLEQWEQHGAIPGQTTIYLYWRNPMPAVDNEQALRQQWMNELVYTLLEKSLRQTRTDYTTHYELGIDKEGELPALGLRISCFTGREQPSIQEVMGEVNWLKQNGIAESDYEQYKEQLDTHIEQRDTSSLQAVFKAYGQRILDHKPLEINLDSLKKQWLAALSYERVNTALKAFLQGGPKDIAVVAPKGASVLTLTEDQFRSWFETTQSDIGAYTTTRVNPLLTEDEAAALSEVGHRLAGFDALGGMELRLDNGVRVILYQLKGAPLAIHGFRKVGAGSLDAELTRKGYLVPVWVHQSGVGGFTSFELQDLLQKKGMIYGRALYVDDHECGIRLKASPAGLEELLQLTYLYLTAVTEHPKAFTYWQEEEVLLYNNPPYGKEDYDFNVLSKRDKDDPDAGITALERYKAVQNTNRAELDRVYKSLFQKPQEFTFLISGDFKEVTIIPLLKKYFGNLPEENLRVNTNCQMKDNLAKASVCKRYRMPHMQPATLKLKIEYNLPIARKDWKEQVALQLMHQVLKSKIPELRFLKKRGLYVNSVASYVNYDLQQGNMSISLPTVGGMEAVLLHDVEELLKGFTNRPLAEQELKQLKKRVYLRGIVGKSVLEKAYRYYKWDMRLPELEEVQSYLNQISPQDVQQLFQQKLVPEHRSVFIAGAYEN